MKYSMLRPPKAALRALGFLSLLLALAGGCSNDDANDLPKAPVQCEVDNDCMSDESCEDNKCVLLDACEEDEDCPSIAWFCTYPAQRCEMRDGFGEECSDEDPCEPGYFCALGKCRDTSTAIPCGRRTDCPLGQICDRRTFYCIEEGPCTLADTYPELACEPDQVCDTISGLCRGEDSGQCTPETVEDDCGPNMYCDASSRCVQCLEDEHCGAGLICNTRAGRCESENLCYDDSDCPPHLYCEPTTALCQVPPPACEDDFDCEVAEICNRSTGRCELLDGACIDDYLEDSDSPSNAETVVLPTDATERIYDGLMLCPDDDDLFAIALSAGDHLHIEVTDTDSKARATIWLLDSLGETSLQYVEAPPRGDGTLDYVADADENIYLRINALLGATDYNLTIQITPGQPCTTDDYEGDFGNEDHLTAHVITGGNDLDTLDAAICSNDVDHYAYTLAPGEALRATLSLDGSATDLDLAFVDATNGDLILSSSGIGNTETLTHRVVEERTIIVRVRGYHNNKGDYGLQLERLPPFVCPDEEVTTQNLELTSPYSATSLAICRDVPRTYTVTVQPYERLVALASFNRADLTLAMAVLSEDGTQTHQEIIYRNGQGSITYQPWQEETVQLKVWGYVNTQGEIDLQVFKEAQLSCIDDASEPNDLLAAAVTVPENTPWLTLCENDEDIFMIEALEDKTISARIEFIHADGDLDLILWGIDGVQVLAASDTTNNYEEIVLAAPVTGTYYIRVFSLANDVSARYTLNVDIQ